MIFFPLKYSKGICFRINKLKNFLFYYKIVICLPFAHAAENNYFGKLDLIKNYGDFKAVKGISFDVYEEGEIFGLLSPNRAGKSTTLEIIETLRAKTGALSFC